MRLIDADKIHWEYKCISKEEIDDEPTVQAIPIEWLYEWRRKNNENYNVGVSSFSQMISDWEKENE